MHSCFQGAPVHVSPGNYSTGGSVATRTSETICPIGSNYCPGDGLIYPCPVGRYGFSSGLMSANCAGPCTAGYFCNVGSLNSTAGALCGVPVALT